MVLAGSDISQSDRITIELHQPPDSPAFVLIRWPAQATPLRRAAYADTASATMQLLAQPHIQLARIKARRL